jgi:hypothetical protein
VTERTEDRPAVLPGRHTWQVNFAVATEAAGSADLCFVTNCSADQVRAHLSECGVEVIAGPVTRVGALGAMTSHYCRDIDRNLIEIAV